MNSYIELIKEKHAELTIERYALNTEGQNNDAIVINDEYIFKFPKYLQSIEKLKKETVILDMLKRYISLDIPVFEFVNCNSPKVGQAYCGYKMIEGVSLRRDIFLKIHNKEKIANQLAEFLKELHGIPLEVIDSRTVETVGDHSHWKKLYERIEENLFPFMRKSSQELITESFSSFLKANINFVPTLIHGDFGPSNILYDSNKEIISGIIDFNDVSIGDPAVDIASLIGPFGYGEDFVKTFEPIYPNIDKLLKRARFYAGTFALQEAIFGLETGDQEAFNAGMKQYM